MDLKLCIKISEIFVTKTVCELDPRVKKLRYICTCLYVSMLEHILCSGSYISMLVPVCFYAQNTFSAQVPMFLCSCKFQKISKLQWVL